MTESTLDLLMEESIATGTYLFTDNLDHINGLISSLSRHLDDSGVTDPSIRYCCYLQLVQSISDSLFVTTMTHLEENTK